MVYFKPANPYVSRACGFFVFPKGSKLDTLMMIVWQASISVEIRLLDCGFGWNKRREKILTRRKFLWHGSSRLRLWSVPGFKGSKYEKWQQVGICYLYAGCMALSWRNAYLVYLLVIRKPPVVVLVLQQEVSFFYCPLGGKQSNIRQSLFV